jgi:hypothetical protein
MQATVMCRLIWIRDFQKLCWRVQRCWDRKVRCCRCAITSTLGSLVAFEFLAGRWDSGEVLVQKWRDCMSYGLRVSLRSRLRQMKWGFSSLVPVGLVKNWEVVVGWSNPALLAVPVHERSDGSDMVHLHFSGLSADHACAEQDYFCWICYARSSLDC